MSVGIPLAESHSSGVMEERGPVMGDPSASLKCLLFLDRRDRYNTPAEGASDVGLTLTPSSQHPTRMAFGVFALFAV